MWCHFTRRTKAEIACALVTLSFLKLTMEYVRKSRLCVFFLENRAFWFQTPSFLFQVLFLHLTALSGSNRGNSLSQCCVISE